MFGSVGLGEVLVLVIVGLVVFGPEKLPEVARDAGRLLRQLRRFAQQARAELRQEVGPELAALDLRDLHPRRFVEKHLFGDDDGQPVPGPAAPQPRLAAEERPPFDSEAT